LSADGQARARAVLDELERAEWFSAVGHPVPGDLALVGSWEEAIASCSSPEWDDLQLEAANELTGALAGLSRPRFDAWNDLVEGIRPLVIELVARKTRDVVARHALPKVFLDTVQWDVLHACMEAAYADLHPPAFFAGQAAWYARGHFPCGWEGTFPGGRLVLY
jgi:hypothetical protein